MSEDCRGADFCSWQGYEIVRAEHRSDALGFIDERSRRGDFKSIVIETMQRQHQANGALWCMFLVDDIIIKTPWPLDGGKPMRRLETDPRVLCLSPRMCLRYDHCYSENRPVNRLSGRSSGAGTGARPAAARGYPMSDERSLQQIGRLAVFFEVLKEPSKRARY